MSVLKTLRERVAPELNHLYTIAPFEAEGRIECGWHGREHALHAFFVARMFGAEADLRTGDFAVISRFAPPLTSMGSEHDHAWCSINGTVPVDLGMTFGHFGTVPQLRSAIIGEGPNGDWHVHYAEDESVLDAGIETGNELIFIEKKVHTETEAALLGDPFLFLKPPRTGEPADWRAAHGPDIYAKITLHAFACANGQAKALRQKMTAAEAAKWIAENYVAPDAVILKHLAKK